MKLPFSSLRPDPATSALVEQQMRRWLALQDVAERPVIRHSVARRRRPHISVSREAGSGGEEIARLAGERLGWDVLDKELVDAVAARFHWPRDVLDSLDETSNHLLSDAVGTWIDHNSISQEKFVHCLANLMRAAAERGNVVIVGRGAVCVLQQPEGLKVRLTAPLEFRVEQVMARRRVDSREARRIVEQTDRNRREFALRYFHQDITDPRLYDLVIDVEELGEEGAARQIVDAVESKFAQHRLAMQCA